MYSTRLLIVTDSLTRNNGAHVATRAMISALRSRGVTVDLLLCNRTDDMVGLEGVRQYEVPLPKRGLTWLAWGIYKRLKWAPVPKWVLDPFGTVRRVIRQYDTVLVVGENSNLRNLVSGLKGVRKVVFIHTDYVLWKDSCARAIEDSRFDRLIYRGFDIIAVVGQPNADRFAAYYPEFASKTRAFHNLFYTAFKQSGDVKSTVQPLTSNLEPIRLVTISRLELGPPKMMERLVHVAGELKRRGCVFSWSVYGKGSAQDEAQLKALAEKENVTDMLHFAGFTSEPLKVLATADLHILLSSYEGAPNVIFEALTLGVPCISTDVGAVHEMLEDGMIGVILPQNDFVIVNQLGRIIQDCTILDAWRRNLVGYRYDNEKVLREYKDILTLT